MSSKNCLLLFVVLIIGFSNAYSQRRSVVSDVRFHKLRSQVFENTRTLRVLVPPGYKRNRAKRYSVLYLNDGQNLFQIRTAQSKHSEWGIDETYKDLMDSREIEPIIIVGIDNAGRAKRANEYLPYEDEFLTPPLPNPNGSKYPKFITEEVMPFIAKNYRIKKGTKFTGLGGSSYGALISLYTAIKKPNVFGKLLLESPSFYVNDGKIFEEIDEIEALPKQFYIGVGTNEEAKPNCTFGDQSHEAVQDVLKLKKILQDKNIEDKNLKVLIEDCAVHSEAAYGRRFYDAMRFLYPRKTR